MSRETRVKTFWSDRPPHKHQGHQKTSAPPSSPQMNFIRNLGLSSFSTSYKDLIETLLWCWPELGGPNVGTDVSDQQAAVLARCGRMPRRSSKGSTQASVFDDRSLSVYTDYLHQ